MKTFITALFLLSLPLLAQEIPVSLPPEASTLARQFKDYETKTRAEAERNIQAAREKLTGMLMEQSRAAKNVRPGDSVLIDAYVAALRGQSREATAPDATEYWATAALNVAYYTNNQTVTVPVATTGKKRFLVIEGNQDKVKTEGEIYLVRGTTEVKIGEWKSGMPNPITIDITGNVTKPGSYEFKFRYKDGGNGFKSSKVGVTVKK